uniref:Uncharacterized protein ycf23 n=1 Tax=Polyneura bonnemaisonii TaxID=136797 RepID=A0A4D6X2U1_9FLOR|nr:hypothetical protein [Polyneura bonnemaisonii]
MQLFHEQLYNLFKLKRVIKVISGLNNSNINQIIKIVKSAGLLGASYIDIVSNTKVVKIVKSIIYLSICVSSIDPLELYNSMIAASCNTYISSSVVIFYGASGIGIYSAIKYKKIIYDMTFYIKQIYFSLYYQKKIYNNNFLINLKQTKVFIYQ